MPIKWLSMDIRFAASLHCWLLLIKRRIGGLNYYLILNGGTIRISIIRYIYVELYWVSAGLVI